MSDRLARGGGPIRLTELSDRSPALAAVREIFFESSSRTEFDSEDERESFLHRWTSAYLGQYPEHVWLWIETHGSISGYITGCLDSAGAESLYTSVPGYAVFESCFEEFPAHFHVNCRSHRRNMGIGAGLVDAFVKDCRAAGLAGVHVVTAPEARNVRFYDRVGFTQRVMRAIAGRPLLLMGRRLVPEIRE